MKNACVRNSEILSDFFKLTAAQVVYLLTYSFLIYIHALALGKWDREILSFKKKKIPGIQQCWSNL